MTDATLSSPAASENLLQVRFVDAAPAGSQVLARFTDPRACVAVATAAPAGELPAIDGAAGQLSLLFLPDGADAQGLSRAQAEAWINPPGKPPAAKVSTDGCTVFWRRGAALVRGPAAQRQPMIEAVTEFAFYEGELRSLEEQIAADWDAVQADSPLVHDVNSSHLPRRGEIAHRTQRTLERRIRCSRLEKRFFTPAEALLPARRRLIDALFEEADVEDRMEILDGQLDVFEYVYEMVNQRMGEYANFRKEFLVEILIVLMLAAEVTIMLCDYFL